MDFAGNLVVEHAIGSHAKEKVRVLLLAQQDWLVHGIRGALSAVEVQVDGTRSPSHIMIRQGEDTASSPLGSNDSSGPWSPIRMT